VFQIGKKTVSAGQELKKIYLLGNPEKLALVTDNGFFCLIDKTDGKVIVKKKLEYHITTVPFCRGEKIYFGTDDKKIVNLSLLDGHLFSETIVKSVPTIITPSDNDLIYYGDNTGFVFAIREKNKKARWSAITGAAIADITILPEGLLVSSNDNFVYLLSGKSGDRIWKRRLNGRPSGKPLVRNETAVFSSAGSKEAVFLDLRKGKVVNQIYLKDDNYFIGNPLAGAEKGSVVFPTFKGLYAFVVGENCSRSEK
jgi:outer membrane protein assembly factor BamB